jgi:hypothetical protein
MVRVRGERAARFFDANQFAARVSAFLKPVGENQPVLHNVRLRLDGLKELGFVDVHWLQLDDGIDFGMSLVGSGLL